MMKNNPETISKYDVIILGAGAAGLRTAIELHKHHISCLLISKRKHDDAHTRLAAGGINASLGSLDPEDSWEIHAADTIREGYFINDPLAVEVVCKSAPEAVKELKEWGCDFNMTKDGKINQRFFGAQSFRRTCFSGDQTGEAILQTLVSKAKKLGIAYRDDISIFKILKDRDKVIGALGYDLQENRLVNFKAPVVVIACGGYASVYSRSSSRKDENTGDSIGLAWHAGAAVMDMEMVQFHPTGMVKPESYLGKLVTEAVRGEGGKLFNKNGERFMEKYSPEKMELDTRDEVARSIAREILKGNGTEDGGVFLDISHREEAFIKERLPDMYNRFKELGIDIAKEPMEVAPTSHYSMGGIEVDFTTGSTRVKGLYAVGEATAGLHGANRLGGNSLAETVVLGKITGQSIAKLLNELKSFGNSTQERELYNKEDVVLYENPYSSIKEIKNLMWLHAGLLRSEETLKEGLRKLEEIKNKIRKKKFVQKFSPEDFMASIDLTNVLLVSELILKSALERKESRGAHFREDFPEEVNSWCKNIIFSKNDEGLPVCETKKPQQIREEVKRAISENYQLNYHQLE